MMLELPLIGSARWSDTDGVLFVCEDGATVDLAEALQVELDLNLWKLQYENALRLKKSIQFEQAVAQSAPDCILATISIILGPLDSQQFYFSIGLPSQTSAVLNQNQTPLSHQTAQGNMFKSCFWFAYPKANTIIFPPTFAEHLGYASVDELPRRLDKVIEITHPDDREATEKHLQIICNGDVNHELESRALKKDGTYVWMGCRATNIIRDEKGDVVLLSGVDVDINDRKLMEIAIETEKLLLERLYEHAPFALYKGRSGGDCLSVNEKYCEVTGLTREQSLGKGWISMLDPEDLAAFFEEWKSTKPGQTFDNVYPIRASSGERRWLRVFWNKDNYDPETAEAENKLSFGMMVDVTDEVQIRQELERQTVELSDALRKAEQAMRFKSEFLAVVSHEIRTPLNGILGMASLIEGSHLIEDERHMLNIIMDCGNSLLELVNDVLELSKIEAGSMELDICPVNLHDLLQSILNMFTVSAATKELALRLNFGENVPDFINSDSIKLKRVLMNLVGNAIKFTEKGSVDIRCSSERYYNEHGKEECTLHFEVEDTGIGINEEGLKRLFLPFSQVDSSVSRRFGGTGLGLAISKKIIEMMGMFDVSVNGSPEHILSEPDLSHSWKSLSILVVEDNKINQQLAVRMLKKLGVEAHVASDGFEGIDAVNKTVYDLILMDISMPGMSGLEATHQIREKSPEFYIRPPRIVAVTANALESDYRQCKEAGMDDFISKPYNLSDLKRALNDCVKYVMNCNQ